MARSDLLLNLVEAERSGDRRRFLTVVESVIAEERKKQHHLVADRLEELISTRGSSSTASYQSPPITQNGLLLEVVPQRRLADLSLPNEMAAVVSEVIEEQRRRDLLRTHGLEPRHRLLLVGPPGNGKTSLAEAIAAELMVPMLVASYEALISSYLGETASRLAAMFEFVRLRECVLFLDEFDTIAKERADDQDTGELKRVVSSLLLGVDRLPSHVILVTASNHPEVLDRAVGRRFQVHVTLSAPSQAEICRFVERQERRGNSFGVPPEAIATAMAGASYSEVEDLLLDARRRYVLGLPDADLKRTVQERLDRWRQRKHHQ
ncbi:MAG: ATP-binding protein [Acidimicrobiaceae bacterium]|nr:ATP-binding protein [Acidimicrobiaceae bacterium]